MMRNENLIEGNLVVGGAATGKTTELANLTESFLLLNPDWHLLALGTHSYLEKLNSSIKYDPRHEIFTCVQINEITQIDFVDRIAEIRLQPDYKVLIVIDESLMFFSDHETRRRFVNLTIDANVDSQSPRSVYTLIATQSFYDFGGFYSTELAANFTEYTLLRTPNTDQFFKISGVDTACIEKGIKFSLSRSKAHSHRFIITIEKINFPAKIRTDNCFDFPAKFMHFSLLALPLLVTSFLYYYNAPSLVLCYVNFWK